MRSYYDECDELKLGKRYDVLHCPFCGSKNTELYQVQVKCERCDAHGPEVAEEMWPLAIALWNELPRKQGKELEKQRADWANMLRRIKRMEKRANDMRRHSWDEIREILNDKNVARS